MTEAKKEFLISSLVAGSLFLTGCAGIVGKNLHSPFEDYYRSAQLSERELEVVLPKYGIKTVINLRGQDDDEWYLDEIKTCQDLNVAHYNNRMSAGRLPKVEEIKGLMDLFERVEYPVLVHCQAGADRSGLASGVYALTILGSETEDARKQLRKFYGHIRKFNPDMDGFFELYENTSQGKDFHAWLEEDYENIRLNKKE